MYFRICRRRCLMQKIKITSFVRLRDVLREQRAVAAFVGLRRLLPLRAAAREFGITDFELGDRQQAVLKLKLARYFQTNDACDTSTLFDAIIETPK